MFAEIGPGNAINSWGYFTRTTSLLNCDAEVPFLNIFEVRLDIGVSGLECAILAL